MKRLHLLISLVCIFSITQTFADSGGKIDFVGNDWDHGSGPQTGWIDGMMYGTSDLTEDISVTVTSSLEGSALSTSKHMTNIDESYFEGFGFQGDPESYDDNIVSMNSFIRIDFVFNTFVDVSALKISDIDKKLSNGKWSDNIAVEFWWGPWLGEPGSGTTLTVSDYNLGANLDVRSLFGFDWVYATYDGNTTNDADSEVEMEFPIGLRSFSIYYIDHSHADGDPADDYSSTHTLGIQGSDFSIRNASPLPILLHEFNCVSAAGVVNIDWKAMAESSDEYFELERSSDGISFTSIATVQIAEQDLLNVVNYTFQDPNPVNGMNYYRLRMVNGPGDYTLSEVKAVQMGQGISLDIYPNPSSDWLAVKNSSAENSEYELYDLYGRLITKGNVASNSSSVIDLKMLQVPTGNYLLRYNMKNQAPGTAHVYVDQ